MYDRVLAQAASGICIFILTFVIAWSLWLPLGIFAPEHYMLSLSGVWAPTISAFVLTRLVVGLIVEFYGIDLTRRERAVNEVTSGSAQV